MMRCDSYRGVIEAVNLGSEAPWRLRLYRQVGDDPEMSLIDRCYTSSTSAKAAARRFVDRDEQGKLVTAMAGGTALAVRWDASTAASVWVPVANGVCRRVYFADEDAADGQVRSVSAVVAPVGRDDQVAAIAAEDSWWYTIRVVYRSEGGRMLAGYVLGGVTVAGAAARLGATQRAHSFLRRPDRAQLRWVTAEDMRECRS